jgi:hypothetical protein
MHGNRRGGRVLIVSGVGAGAAESIVMGGPWVKNGDD